MGKAYTRAYAPETLHLLQELSAREASRGNKVAPAAAATCSSSAAASAAASVASSPLSVRTTPRDASSGPASPAGGGAAEAAAQVAGDPRTRYLHATIAERLKSELEEREQR